MNFPHKNMDWQSASSQLRNKIREVKAPDFEALALEVFRHQLRYNPLYKEYTQLLHIEAEKVQKVSQIPFLPIQFFKSHTIQTGNWEPTLYFSSSGTTQTSTSRHPVRSVDWYLETTERIFHFFYGKLEDYCVLALLPAYLERQGSSLVRMAQHFIERSKHPQSGFFLYNYPELMELIRDCRAKQTPFLLLGVSFALWELSEQYPENLQGGIIMETGGMKGRRKEITREELHALLKAAFQLEHIHSEYGMTELFSQAYSKGEGLFYPAPTMRVMTREITDPLCPQKPGRTGAINVIDLANVDTVSFIATDDVGRVYEDGSFEVLGRMDSSDIRGCNLLIR
jgi:hypothetical protein